MNSCNDLTTASREELLELVGRLLEQVQVLEARIAELEGPQKAAAEILPGEKKPPSWVKANRPTGAKRERKKRAHGFARRREEPTHRTEPRLGPLSPLPGAADGRAGTWAPPGGSPYPGFGLE